MPHFDALRSTPWEPRFLSVSTSDEAADQVNQPHEDYPARVLATGKAMRWVHGRLHGFLVPHGNALAARIPSAMLLDVHRRVFDDTHHAGRYRDVRVRVGPHLPPDPKDVPAFMLQLEEAYAGIETVDELKSWYVDLETIHPFEDGNGRVGGVIVAAYSRHLEPKNGWLATPN